MNRTLKGKRVPAPGRYGGTVEGEPAIFLVTDGDFAAVSAQWFKRAPSGHYRPHQDAWDIEGGRFIAKSTDQAGDYRPVRVSIRSLGGRP